MGESWFPKMVAIEFGATVGPVKLAAETTLADAAGTLQRPLVFTNAPQFTTTESCAKTLAGVDGESQNTGSIQPLPIGAQPRESQDSGRVTGE